MVETDILPGDRPPSVAEVSLGGLPLKVSPGKGNETAVPRSGSIDAQGLVAAVFGGRLWQQTGGVWTFSLAFCGDHACRNTTALLEQSQSAEYMRPSISVALGVHDFLRQFRGFPQCVFFSCFSLLSKTSPGLISLQLGHAPKDGLDLLRHRLPLAHAPAGLGLSSAGKQRHLEQHRRGSMRGSTFWPCVCVWVCLCL